MTAAVVVVGLAWGLAVGTALVAFLTVLDIVPRLTHLTRTARHVWLYEYAIAAGAVAASAVLYLPLSLPLGAAGAAAAGLVAGLFVGLFTSAIAEVTNLLPVLGRRTDMARWVALFVLALVVGKTAGSLLQWLLPVLQ